MSNKKNNPPPTGDGPGAKTSSHNIKMAKKAHWAHHNAKARCTNPKNPSWPTYGGAGIKYKFASPAALIESIGLPKDKSVSLDRINPNGHYEPGNVRWANTSVQAANKKASSGGSLPTPQQLVAKFEKVAAQPAHRVKVTVAWKRCVQAVGRGYFTSDDVDVFKWANLSPSSFSAGWQDGQIRDAAEEPSYFDLPSISEPGATIRLRGGPFDPGPQQDSSQGIRGMKIVPLEYNLPAALIEWLNADINDKAKAGAIWAGQSSPKIRAAGGVDGWMLACVPRVPKGRSAAILPAASLVRLLTDPAKQENFPELQPLSADLLFVPDLQVDGPEGYDLSFDDFMRVKNLLQQRRASGKKTFVGVHNVHKLPKPLQAEIFGHLKLRMMEELVLPHFSALPPTPTGPVVSKDGRFGFSAVRALLLNKEPTSN